MTDRRRWILVAAVLGSGIVFLDSTVVNVALPRIGQDLPRLWFGVLEGQSYVYNAYMLSLCALLILAGALSDVYGRRRMFLWGLVGFGVTSVLCGLAPNMELLVLFRVLQGVAGAVLIPGSLALLTANFEGEAQGRAFGLWAGASGATTILGPFVGGLLVDTISWRAAFLINVPLILVALWATWVHVPESRSETATAHFDWIGSAIVALAVGGLAFGTIYGQQRDWQDPVGYIALAIGVLATIALPFYMARAAPADPPLALPLAQLHGHEHLDPFNLWVALRHLLLPDALHARNDRVHGGRGRARRRPRLALCHLSLGSVRRPRGPDWIADLHGRRPGDHGGRRLVVRPHAGDQHPLAPTAAEPRDLSAALVGCHRSPPRRDHLRLWPLVTGGPADEGADALGSGAECGPRIRHQQRHLAGRPATGRRPHLRVHHRQLL